MLTFAFMASAIADTSSYQQGLNAVKQKNYTLAIEYFNQAIHSTTISSDKRALIHFNLGICYYRTARFDEANDNFKQAMLSDILLWRSVFNLALVAEKQQRIDYAIKLYDKIIADSNNEQLTASAAIKVSKLSAQLSIKNTAKTAQPVLATKWAGILFAGVGRDTDVIDPQDLISTGGNDTFREVFAGVYRPLLSTDNSTLLLDAKVYSLRYKLIDDFDINLQSVGLKQQWHFEKQLTSIGITVEQSTIGSEDYLRHIALQAANQWRLTSSDKLRLRYRYIDYDALSDLYEPFDGNRQELQLSWTSSRISNMRWRSHVFVVSDNRADRLENFSFTSFSSLRHGVYAAWDYRNKLWQWTVNVRYRNSHYNGLNTLPSYEQRRRDDDQVKVGTSVKYSITPEWALNLEYEYTDNQSNIKRYSYNSNIVSATISYEF